MKKPLDLTVIHCHISAAHMRLLVTILVASVAIVVGVLPSSALAANVQLVSELCDQSSQLFSTGYVTLINDRPHVIASADFVFNSPDSKFCHRVVDSVGNERARLKLKRHDWGAGLALLEVISEGQVAASALQPVQGKMLQKVTTATGLDPVSGLIVSAQSRRHHFPVPNAVLEIKLATNLSAKAVGGAVVDTHGQVLGFVASQYVEEIPGSQSRVVRWLDRQKAESKAIAALPAIFVKSWVDAIPTTAEPVFHLDVQDQIDRVLRVRIGEVVFTEACKSELVRPNNGDPAGIGGGDPVGIGGGDPVGIGGDDLYKRWCDVAVSPALSGLARAPIRADWIQRLALDMTSGVQVMVRDAYTRDTANILQPLTIYSLGHFGQMALREEFGFVVGRKGAPVDQSLKELYEAALSLRQQASMPWGAQIAVNERAFLYTRLILSGDWQVVSIHDLEALAADAEADRSGRAYIADHARALLDAMRRVRQQ